METKSSGRRSANVRLGEGLKGAVEQAKEFRRQIKEAMRGIKQAECYVTRLKWQYGHFLLDLKATCKHGEWGKLLTSIGETEPRFSEASKIARYFKSADAAGSVPFKVALKRIRFEMYDIYENCFSTPQWLRDAVTRDYGFPALDVCSSHGMHFGKRWYAPKNDEHGKGAIGFDAMKQDWRKDCPIDGVAWCNSPYAKPILHAFTEKCFKESRKGLTIIQLIPVWLLTPKQESRHCDLVLRNCEIRQPKQQVLQDGFGPKSGRAANHNRDYINVYLAIWRKGQRGFTGSTIYPVGKEPKSPDRQCWRTPKPLFKQLHSACKFTIDACADASNNLLPKYWSEKQDARKQDWRTHRAFVNPPFAEIESFLPKCEQAKLAAVILPVGSLTTSYFAKHAPTFLVVPSSRIEFDPPEGIEPSSPNAGSVIAFYGDTSSVDLDRLSSLGLRFVVERPQKRRAA